MNVTIRRAEPQDSARCAEIFYKAFTDVAEQHNFPPDVEPPDTSPESKWTKRFVSPDYYVIVAMLEGRVVGLNMLDERDPIAGVGPITVDPEVQDQRIGRALMEDVLKRCEEKQYPGVRLVQAAYNRRSLVLYSKLGFEVREFLVSMQGPPLELQIEGHEVRSAKVTDLERCNELCQKVHGIVREGPFADALEQGTATVVENGDRITGYASSIGFSGHAVGESNDDLKALIGAAPELLGPAGFLLPARNGELFRWCLENGLRVVQPMTLMSQGFYQKPTSPFLPSIYY